MATSKLRNNAYIVESGTDGIWEYRKWSDGTAECWGIKTESVTCSVISSPWVRGAMSATNFPSNLFINSPAVSVTGYSSYWATLGTTNSTSIAYIYIYDVAAGTATRYIHIHAIGKWK